MKRTRWCGSGWASPPRPTPRKSPTCPGCPIRNGRPRPAGSMSRRNYQFILDNLLDLTHVAHVHKKTIAGDPREATTPTKTERLPDGVRVGRWMLDFVPPPLFAKAGNFNNNVDRWQYVTWHPPGVRLSRRRLRQGRHRRAAGRSQPGHLDLVEPPGHARDRAHEPLHVRLCAQLQAWTIREMSKLLYEGSRATFLEDVDFWKRCKPTGSTARSMA